MYWDLAANCVAELVTVVANRYHSMVLKNILKQISAYKLK